MAEPRFGIRDIQIRGFRSARSLEFRPGPVCARDAAPGRAPSHAEQVLNAQIATLAGADATIELARDFEAVAGLRGHRHKPTRAFEHFAHLDGDGVPGPLRDAVEKALALARG